MKKIKKKLSFLYKNLIKLLFIFIYGKVIFCENPEGEKDISIEKVKDDNLKDPDNLRYSIYKIKNGRIFNDFVENVAIISGNKLIKFLTNKLVANSKMQVITQFFIEEHHI